MLMYQLPRSPHVAYGSYYFQHYIIDFSFAAYNVIIFSLKVC